LLAFDDSSSPHSSFNVLDESLMEVILCNLADLGRILELQLLEAATVEQLSL